MVISGKILDLGTSDKLRVGRFTAKSRHRRVVGSRSKFARVQIDKITSGAQNPSTQTLTKGKEKSGK
jgi:ribosomal protein L21